MFRLGRNGSDIDAVGHEETTVETQTWKSSGLVLRLQEVAKKLRTERANKIPLASTIRALSLSKELTGSGFGQGSEVRGELLRGHANTIVYRSCLRMQSVKRTKLLPVIIMRPPEPSSSFTALMVMFKGCSGSETCLSVREISRSFSSASLALESNSRRKMSLSDPCQ